MSKKKPPLRNEFTDALDEEISARKILERANLKEPPKVEPTPEKIEVPAPPTIVAVETNPELEQRALKEADNTFFDEKPAPKSDDSHKKIELAKSGRKSVYRSKALRRWDEEQDSDTPPKNPVAQEPEIEPPRRMSRPEKAGAVISIAMVAYAFSALDKPLFFLAMSLLVHSFRPLIGAFSGKYNQPVQNALRSFSIVLFFGSILFIFL